MYAPSMGEPQPGPDRSGQDAPANAFPFVLDHFRPIDSFGAEAERWRIEADNLDARGAGGQASVWRRVADYIEALARAAGAGNEGS